jgi:hypothetical protein
MMAAGATEPRNAPNPFPRLGKLGTAPTAAQQGAIAAASDRIERLRSALRCKRRTRELANASVDTTATFTSGEGAYWQDIALAYRGAGLLDALRTNDSSRQTPEAQAEGARELVDSLEIALLLATDGLQTRRTGGQWLMEAIAPYLAAHLAELPPSALDEIVQSDSPSFLDDVAAERLRTLGEGMFTLASSDAICAHSGALACAFEAREAMRMDELFASVAASSDRPFVLAECTNKADAIAGGGQDGEALGLRCSPFAASAKARAPFEALKVAARERLARSVPAPAAN